MGSDPLGAAGHFRKALEIQPSSDEALYGLGYALLQGGQPADAQVQLCKVVSGSSDSRLVGEVKGILSSNELSCD